MTVRHIERGLDEIVESIRAAGVGTEDSLVVPTVRVGGVTIDSRRCGPRDLFVCIPGRHHDGHDHAHEAIASGALALVVEHALDIDAPQIIVESSRRAIGPIAACIHGDPSLRTPVIGVTGTNGKTTVTAMVASVLESAGRPTSVIGTLNGRLTTPEAPDLQRLIAEAADAGRTVVMEVSSHALAEHRVDAIRFEVAAFTNLGRDHLDLHGTMEEYFRVKASLFTDREPRVAVVNEGDTYGRLLADTIEGSDRTMLVRVNPDQIGQIEMGPHGSSFDLDHRRWTVPLAGRPHVENALIAIGVCRSLGLDDETIADGLSSMPPVPGRLEVIRSEDRDVEVIVDFAHTPDALDALIDTCREIAPDRELILVFGCGGDRDRAKRPEMGRVGCAADRVVLTSDNPRSEDPATIIEQILLGISAPDRDRVTVIVDRGVAIRSVVADAPAHSLVVVAGRGHERVQDVGGSLVEFDDRQVVRSALGGPE
ncbi:MAG: UDP-N-acetylmuramoyl-L-alanyl-D-glutamate--2,6-diaminopimelate ligase [Ilumatobacteraceae bacterium]